MSLRSSASSILQTLNASTFGPAMAWREREKRYRRHRSLVVANRNANTWLVGDCDRVGSLHVPDRSTPKIAEPCCGGRRDGRLPT